MSTIPSDLIESIKVLRTLGVASFELVTADGFTFKALITPPETTPMTEAERHAILESPDVSEARKRELKREQDQDLYGAA